MKLTALAVLLTICAHTVAGDNPYSDNNPRPTLDQGARVFTHYCTLCHGSKGMGDGALPNNIANYPDTSLLKPLKSKNNEEILDIVIYGGILENVSEYMPPFGNELSWTQANAVVLFIDELRRDPDRAIRLLANVNAASKSSLRAGRRIYTHRCTLCHGEFGEGDGRIARVIKSPSPADLTASRLPDAYLMQIISEGGEAVGRSKHMPPWKNELSKVDLEAVVQYIKSIRD